MSRLIRSLKRELIRHINECEQLRDTTRDHREVVRLNRLRRATGMLLIRLAGERQKGGS